MDEICKNCDNLEKCRNYEEKTTPCPAEDRHGRGVGPEKVKLTCGDCRFFNPKLVSSCETVGYGTKTDNNPCDRFKSKPKPLAWYLSEYLDSELVEVNADNAGWRTLLKQALVAYQETENVKIRIERG